MSKRILIAEDDAAIRKLVLRVLTREGLEVECVSNGLDAIARIQTAVYDGVILDLMMPSLSGYDFLAWVRETKPEMTKKLIVVTAAAEREIRKIHEGDVCAILRKPFDLDDLVRIVRTCTAECGPEGSAGPEVDPSTQPV